MNLDTRGLADGFIRGFRTMADYQAQQKADARADEAMTMQKEEYRENSDYRKKTWDHGLEVEKKTDTRYEEEKGYNRTRQADLDALAKKQAYAQMANDSARTGIASSAANVAAENAKRQNKLTDLQIEQAEQQQWLEDNKALLRGGWTSLVAGRPLTEQQAAALNDKRSGAMNINRYTDKTYVAAATKLNQNVKQIMSSFTPDQFNSQSFYNQLNTPEMKGLMNTVFRDEINKGVGYVDPTTGKKVAQKEFGGVVPLESGALALTVVPVYEDGSKGQPQPVTVNRSNDPNDQVRAFSPSELVGVIGGRAQMAGAIKNPETLLQDIGVAPAPDDKGYRKAVAEATAATQKAKAKIDMEAAKGTIPPEEVTKLKGMEDASLESIIKSYERVYSIDNTPQPRQGGDDAAQQQLTEWVGSDPMKQQYLQYATKTGRFNPQAPDLTGLDNNFKAYVTEQKNKSLEQAVLQDKIKQAQQNQSRY